MVSEDEKDVATTSDDNMAASVDVDSDGSLSDIDPEDFEMVQNSRYTTGSSSSILLSQKSIPESHTL